MHKKCIGIINLDENEDRIRELTRNRPLASIPLAGRYRIIDFILSNLTNAGIESVGIFTKTQSRSLMDHLGSGRPWDLDRKVDGLRIFNFSAMGPQMEDISIFAENLDYLYKCRQEYVIMAPSYMVCNIDLREAFAFHIDSDNDITIIYKNVNDANENYFLCNTLTVDKNDMVSSVGRNIGDIKVANICMEMFIMKKELLIDIIKDCVTSGKFRKVKSAIYNSLEELRAGAYEYKGYLRCINSLQTYYKTSMELLDQSVYRQLFINERPIYTKTGDEAPARYMPGCRVKNSIIGNGSIIEGEVENSIIFRRVRIEKGAAIRNSIIMQESTIGERSILTNIITDKYTDIASDKELKGDEEIPLVIEKKIII